MESIRLAAPFGASQQRALLQERQKRRRKSLPCRRAWPISVPKRRFWTCWPTSRPAAKKITPILRSSELIRDGAGWLGGDDILSEVFVDLFLGEDPKTGTRRGREEQS